MQTRDAAPCFFDVGLKAIVAHQPAETAGRLRLMSSEEMLMVSFLEGAGKRWCSEVLPSIFEEPLC